MSNVLSFARREVDAAPGGALACEPAYHAPVRLRCPQCHARVRGLVCAQCRFHMALQAGIVQALPPERSEYFARFIADYERIRAAEGRGSESDAYYLGLPYVDVTGRNSEQWLIRAHSFDCLRSCALSVSGGQGKVLDLGAGNCWMSFRLASAGYQPVAVDLLSNDRDGLGAATHYERQLAKPLPRFRAEAANLPFEDAQFDAVIFNASFHYAEDYEIVLREALRCAKPDGLVIISDTPWYSRAESGARMVAERRAMFLLRYGTASHALKSEEYLTDKRLKELAERCGIRWEVHQPSFGLRWAMRPWLAKLRGRREPSRFRIYVAKKHA